MHARCSLAAEIRITQVVNMKKCIHVTIPKALNQRSKDA
jgi:acetamidase/formamidase